MIWIVTYSDVDFHENIIACATLEIAEREKQKLIDQKIEFRKSQYYEIESFKVVDQ